MNSGTGSTKKRWLAVAAIIMTTIFWGFSYISTKRLLNSLTPLQVAGGRFLIASVVLVVVGLVSGRLSKVERADRPRMFGAAFLGIALYFVFENFGLKLTTAGMGSLIIATIPVINAVVAGIFLKQTISGRSWLGVLLSMVGVFMVIRAGSNFSFNSLWGNLLVLGAAASWVGYTILNQPLTAKYDTLNLNIYQTLVGTIFLLSLSFGEGHSWPGLNLEIISHIGFLAICCSALAYVFYLYALKYLGATVVTTFINFIPVCGVMGGVIFLGEKISVEQLIGGLVIIAGVMLVTLSGCGFKRNNSQKVPSNNEETSVKAAQKAEIA
ncbi:MAG: DMT family transporter [Bacteroidota bacterium]